MPLNQEIGREHSCTTTAYEDMLQGIKLVGSGAEVATSTWHLTSPEQFILTKDSFGRYSNYVL